MLQRWSAKRSSKVTALRSIGFRDKRRQATATFIYKSDAHLSTFSPTPDDASVAFQHHLAQYESLHNGGHLAQS